jgi:foldase protein PrsA
MGEGNHLNQAASTAKSSFSRIWFAIGGTVVVLIAGLVLMQTFRPQAGQAAAEPAGNKAAPPKRPDLAKVGKEAISYDLVAQECVNRYGKEVLEDLINRLIIEQACRASDITVTEDEVNAEIARISKRFNLDPEQWYNMLQAERGISKTQYRQSVIWPMLALKKLAGEQVNITEEEVDKSFVRNYGPRVKCKLILLDNLKRAQDVWEKATQNPEEFETLAQKYSIDSTSKSLGGTIPPIPRYSGMDALESTAFKLKEGQISGLIEIKSNQQYAILKCEGRTEQVVFDKAEVQDSLYEELLETKTQQSVAKVFMKLKENSQVDNYLTQTSTGTNRPFTQAAPGAIQQTSGQRPTAPATTPGAARPGTATPGVARPGTSTTKR